MEYGGAYASEEQLAAARGLYRLAAPTLALLTVVAVFLVFAALGRAA